MDILQYFKEITRTFVDNGVKENRSSKDMEMLKVAWYILWILYVTRKNREEKFHWWSSTSLSIVWKRLKPDKFYSALYEES